MKSKTTDLSVEEIKNSLPPETGIIGKKIFFFDSLVSTNTLAMELASNGCEEGTVIISDEQTGGKGRLGRSWISPPRNNLYLSIVLRPHIPPRDAAILTLMSAVACTHAVKSVSGVPVSIKWPNDMMVANRKLGGILTEIKTDMDGIKHAIIGIGININTDISEMHENIKTIATSIMIETRSRHSRQPFVVEMLKEMNCWYKTLISKGKKPILAEWLKLSSTIGRTVQVTIQANQATSKIKGIAEGIDNEGMLILKLSNGSYKKICAGDVSILP